MTRSVVWIPILMVAVASQARAQDSPPGGSPYQYEVDRLEKKREHAEVVRAEAAGFGVMNTAGLVASISLKWRLGVVINVAMLTVEAMAWWETTQKIKSLNREIERTRTRGLLDHVERIGE